MWKHQASEGEQAIASALILLPANWLLEEADPSVSHTKEGAERSLAAEIPPTRANYSPTYNINTRKSKSKQCTHLTLTPPSLDVFRLTATTGLYISICSHEHFRSGNDISNGRLSWILARNPNRHRNVIRRASIRDSQQAMNTDEKLCTTIIVRYIMPCQ